MQALLPIVNLTVMEDLNALMGLIMKDNGKITWNMASENINGKIKMEISEFIMAIGWMIQLVGKENIHGMMEEYI